jgi:uncharacterized protein YcbK (DUF882 family)
VKYFTRKEFACKCCDVYQIDAKLARALDELRRLFGKPIVLTSGYRCEKHNEAVGGKQTSYHLTGQAADIALNYSEFECALLLDIIKNDMSYVLKGVGIAKHFVHVDVRSRATHWSY